MVRLGYLSGTWKDNDFVKDFILIEPSRANLLQASEYVSAFFNEAEITTINKTEENITADAINPKHQTVIHFFSNVLDLEDFQGDKSSNILSEDKKHNNNIVCVSPFYQDNSRGKRMDEFGEKLKGYSCIYKFEKHTDEWGGSYSCQIRIFVSSYY